jgi:hypothetical protein
MIYVLLYCDYEECDVIFFVRRTVVRQEAKPEMELQFRW